MSRRAREHLAFILFFPSLAYLVFKGWESFAECGYTGRGWYAVLVPTLLASLALLIWPSPLTRDRKSE